MVQELGQISFYMAKEGNTFNSVITEDDKQDNHKNILTRTFELDDAQIKFMYLNSKTVKQNPPWLDFVNEKISSEEEKISFNSTNHNPNGMLLIKIEDVILAATFGIKGSGLLDKTKCHSDFGIIVAMNMCGNNELRQAKTCTHSINTKNINRQLSKPSEAFDFGLGDSELLKYISARLEENENVTLQGKDNLTIKVIGENKLDWTKLVEYCKTFIKEYDEEKYKTLFPNYPNFQDISDSTKEILNTKIISKINNSDFSCIHLAIPEFISDDQYSFSYSNYAKRNDYIVSHLLIEHLKNSKIFSNQTFDINRLNNIRIYAYSHEQSRIIESLKWKLFDCIVAEEEISGEYFILSEGVWKKVDGAFYNSVNNFIENTIQETIVSTKYHNINIYDHTKKQNREYIFNKKYCDDCSSAILFDTAHLRIAQSTKDKEFCDILELKSENQINIIHVKRHGGSSAINHLFSQARFYCEFFLTDEVFLSEIRNFISESKHEFKDLFLNHIKENQEEVNGKDYQVSLWVLYDKNKPTPITASNLPLMAKYEIKLTYEKLRKALKFNKVNLSFIPVETIQHTESKSKN